MSQISDWSRFCSKCRFHLSGSQPSAALWFVCLLQRKLHITIDDEVRPWKRMKRRGGEVWNLNSLFSHRPAGSVSLSVLFSHSLLSNLLTVLLSFFLTFCCFSLCCLITHVLFSFTSLTLIFLFCSTEFEPICSFLSPSLFYLTFCPTGQVIKCWIQEQGRWFSIVIVTQINDFNLTTWP